MISINSEHDKTPYMVVIAMYKFVHLHDYLALKLPLLKKCRENNLRGTILLAEEGINATVAGSRTGIDNLFKYLGEDERFSAMEGKESIADEIPFHRMKVKIKKEIVLHTPHVQGNQIKSPLLRTQFRFEAKSL